MASEEARRSHCGGFTLLEVLVAVSIGALLIQIVVANLGAFIPAKSLDSDARQIVSRLDFLRSEARLQGKTYRLELDLSNHAYHTVLPAEERHLSDQDEKQELGLLWTPLSRDVRFAGYEVAGGARLVSGKVSVIFDATGFSADQTIYLRHATDEDMVWSIQIRGLMGTSRIEKSFDGIYQPLETVTEEAF